MTLQANRRGSVKQVLEAMDWHPWHRCYGLLVWRRGFNEYSFSGPNGGEIIKKTAGIDDAVTFVMQNGDPDARGGWSGGTA